MNPTEVIVCQDLEARLAGEVERLRPDRVFVLADSNTRELCLPLVASCPTLRQAAHITIPAGDERKSIDTLCHVWQALSNQKAGRHSLLVNVGGGMVTDLGGFAAATFKRGIPYINIPTTLLSMVDAAVGGKTAINFNGLKNEVGAFHHPAAVLVSSAFLRTLDTRNLLSGYAEMLKHGLICRPGVLEELLGFDPSQPDFGQLQALIGQSIGVKRRIVEQDPGERGIRKALNLGHTVGHAFESLALSRRQPVLHGYAVAWGLVCELYLSVALTGFPCEVMRSVSRFIAAHYGAFPFTCDHYETLHELMTHDKKNERGVINFTLLADVGEVRLNQTAGRELIFETFDFFRECMGM